MDIMFDKPVNFGIDVLEHDERLPSLRVEVKISVDRFNESFLAKKKFWIECEVFDGFLSGLRDERVVLKDMNNEFLFLVDVPSKKISWVFSTSELSGNLCKFEGTSELDDSEASLLVNAFMSFPKWW